jgi:hypothetical protein
MKHPNINSDDFNIEIANIYKKFTIPKAKKSFKEICFPKQFELQMPQRFLAEYINPKTPYKGVLVFHRIGAGKTCTAVQVAEEWKHQRKIFVVVPASLKGNFRNELRSLCAGNNYLKANEREKLLKLHPASKEYKEIIEKSDERINEYYKIYSYNKFIDLTLAGEIKLNNALLMIDEIHNMVSENGTYYNTLLELINNSPSNLRIIIMSATPMFDKPYEIGLTMNLLRIENPLPVGKDFDKKFIQIVRNSSGHIKYRVKNMDLFKESIRGYVSYFRGAPPNVFPEMIVKYVKCEMSDFQYDAYKTVVKNEEKIVKKLNLKKKIEHSLSVSNLPNNFFIGTRVVSNVVFPNKKINETGFESFKGKSVTRDLEKYSTKFNKIMSKIQSSSGKVFVYSGFKEYGGLKSLIQVLDEFGYKDYTKHGEGKKRYAVWSSDENIGTKEEIRAVYNRKDNLNGSKIKILLGSPSIKEGVSLTAVKQVHVLEPYWNTKRLDQVIGRASRFCSHKDLEEDKRVVKVYIYIATHQDEPETVDQYIQRLSHHKNKLVLEFEKALKEVAVDCRLNKYSSVFPGEEPLKCDN